MAGVAGHSGRKKTDITLMKESIALIERSAPDIMQMLIDKAIEGKDSNTGMYLIDRIYGKPKQAIEQKTELTFTLSPEILAARQQELQAQAQSYLLGEYQECDE